MSSARSNVFDMNGFTFFGIHEHPLEIVRCSLGEERQQQVER